MSDEINGWLPPRGPDRSVTLSVSAPGGRLDTLQIGMEPDWALGDWVTVPSLPVTGLAEIPVTDEMLGAAFDTCPALGPMGFGDGQVARIYRAMAALAPRPLTRSFRDTVEARMAADPEFCAALQENRQEAQTVVTFGRTILDQQDRIATLEAEITAIRAERDLWKGLHGDLIAKFSAAVSEPKPTSGHNPFREFGGDRRRIGG